MESSPRSSGFSDRSGILLEIVSESFNDLLGYLGVSHHACSFVGLRLAKARRGNNNLDLLVVVDDRMVETA
jgi:hypothetical protein